MSAGVDLRRVFIGLLTVVGALFMGIAALVLLFGGGGHVPQVSAQPACSSLTIVKQTIPSPDPSNTSFAFTSSDTAPPATILPFNLLNGQSMTHPFGPGDDCFNVVTETVPFGWALVNIVCSGATNSVVNITGAIVNPTNGFEPGDDTVRVDVAAGENVTCTFTNQKIQTGTVTICKVTDPSGGTGFTFGWSAPTIHPLPFMLDDGQCFTVTDLDPSLGPYSFSELQPLPTGWQLANIVCTGGANILIGSDSNFDPGDMGVTINLGPGENVTCTFLNVRASSVIWGDVDCDGSLSAVDALKILQDVVNLSVSQTQPCPQLRESISIIIQD